MTFRTFGAGVALALLALSVSTAAQDPQPAPQPAPPADIEQPAEADLLAVDQSRIADKYAQLEALLIRMAAVEAADNPRRSALLKQAARQSSDRFTRNQLNTLITLLNQQQLKRAIDGQQQALEDMKSLLELLLSENRPDRLKDEQARLRDYIKEVERLIRLQQSLQGRTEGGEDAQRLAGEQGQLADRTDKLAQQIRKNEQDQSGQRQDSQQPQDQNDSQDDQPPSEPGDQPPPSSDGQPQQQPGEPSRNQPRNQNQQSQNPQGQQEQQDQESEDEPSEDEQPQPAQQDQDNPARKRIEAAEQRMREAQQRLDEAKRSESVQQQERAREELEKAKAELEEILRQMREEEIERMLAMLEGRFRKMLEMQIKILEGTVALDQIPAEQRNNALVIQAGRLAFEERKVAAEADKAYQLLLEEGSSIAFPETVDQLREEMEQVADRLGGGNVGSLTQGIEQEIIATLEDLIASLQQAQQDQENKKKQNQPPPPSDSQDMPLVDQLAEIKMIRALQMRVNTRTKRYAQLLENADDPTGQATDQDLQDALRKLAERESKIQQITRDIVLGKNR